VASTVSDGPVGLPVASPEDTASTVRQSAQRHYGAWRKCDDTAPATFCLISPDVHPAGTQVDLRPFEDQSFAHAATSANEVGQERKNVASGCQQRFDLFRQQEFGAAFRLGRNVECRLVAPAAAMCMVENRTQRHDQVAPDRSGDCIWVQ
jgi:hypothetical protein